MEHKADIPEGEIGEKNIDKFVEPWLNSLKSWNKKLTMSKSDRDLIPEIEIELKRKWDIEKRSALNAVRKMFGVSRAKDLPKNPAVMNYLNRIARGLFYEVVAEVTERKNKVGPVGIESLRA